MASADAGLRLAVTDRASSLADHYRVAAGIRASSRCCSTSSRSAGSAARPTPASARRSRRSRSRRRSTAAATACSATIAATGISSPIAARSSPLLAEIFGRPDGVCGGRGGSQHLHLRNFYSNGVQGGTVGNAVGVALAEKTTPQRRRDLRVARRRHLRRRPGLRSDEHRVAVAAADRVRDRGERHRPDDADRAAARRQPRGDAAPPSTFRSRKYRESISTKTLAAASRAIDADRAPSSARIAWCPMRSASARTARATTRATRPCCRPPGQTIRLATLRRRSATAADAIDRERRGR